ncbi:unnamed protein product [Caenorhabditis angaria]|uniref:Neurotransmitter-gated ion-channel ligand-binding domain-containing protein n=1 Tax=Caenorhabditis angaria TaxID=860376 RepID=A0A9P1N8S3_9PELO|nr:unnamed protein product [Caenorhabditis angaria]
MFWLLFLSVCVFSCNASVEGLIDIATSEVLDDAKELNDMIQESFHKLLEDSLIANYSSRKSEFYLNVYVNPAIQHMSIDPVKQTMFLVIYYVVVWEDERLAWDPKKWADVKTITVNSAAIWQPTFHFENMLMIGGKPRREDRPFVTLEMQENATRATVITQFRYNLEFECTMSFDGFPADENFCVVEYDTESPKVLLKDYIWNSRKVDLAFSENDPKMIVSEFEILNVTSRVSLSIDSSHNLLTQSHRTFIYFKRHAPYFFAVFTIPICICAILNMLSFLTSSILVSCFISFASILLGMLFMKDFLTQLPPFINTVPKCVQLYMFVMFINFFSLILHFVSIKFDHIPISKIKRSLSIISKSTTIKDEIPLLKIIRTFFAIALLVTYCVLIVKFLVGK